MLPCRATGQRSTMAAAGPGYCLGGTKRRNSNSNSLFLGSKTGIRFDTKWHQIASNQLLAARISIHFPVRVFLYFQRKWILGFWDKKKNGGELEVLKTRKMILVVFLAFLSANSSNFTDTDAYDFSASPQTPKPSKHVSTTGFLAWRDRKVHASFGTAGTVLIGRFQ